jgi:hypothetical protein
MIMSMDAGFHVNVKGEALLFPVNDYAQEIDSMVSFSF